MSRVRQGVPLVIAALLAVGAAQPMLAQQLGAPQESVTPRAAPQQAMNVDSCVTRLDPQVDIGFERISARCPDLARQLDHSGLAPWLPRGWKETGNDLSAGSLAELRELATRELVAKNGARTLDTRQLNAVLAALGDPGTSHKGVWARFKTWLRSVLESRAGAPEESWWSRTLSHAGVPQSVLELISYAALAGVVALAGLIVANELRTAGLLSRVARKRGDARASGVAAGEGWSADSPASFSERPRLLLELIVRRLNAHGFLPPSRALTVRELTRAARFLEEDDRARLAELALASERVRFSGSAVTAEGLEGPVARGRELLGRLEGSSSP